MTGIKKFAAIFIFLICNFWIGKTKASTSFSSDSSVGSTTFTSGIVYDGDTYDDKPESKGHKKDILNWTGGYTFTQNSSTDSTTGVSTVDQTSDFTAGFGWTGTSHFEASVGLAFATTPAERMTDFGPNINVGYTFHFGHNTSNPQLQDAELAEFGGAAVESKSERKSDDGMTFDSTLTLKETITTLGYTQTFSSETLPTKNRPSRPTTGSSSIRQSNLASELGWSPVKFFKGRYTYTSYKYDKVVSTFIQNLQSPRAVRAGASGFLTALGGFPLEMHELGFSFYFLEDWEFEPYGSAITNISDGTILYVVKGTLSRDIGGLNVGLGYERDNSPLVIDSLILVSFKLNL